MKKLLVLAGLLGSFIFFSCDNGTNPDATQEQNPQVSYSVSYFGNGNTHGSVPIDNSQYASGTDVIILGNSSLEKTGYVFQNWNTKLDGTGDSYVPGDIIKINNAHIFLYAIWTELAKYTVSFDSKGGTDIPTVNDVISGSKITKPTDPTKEGYAFEGWFIEQELNTEWDFQSDTVEKNLTLYAKWKSSLYRHEVSGIYHVNIGIVLMIYWTNPTDSNFSHVRVIPAGFEWAENSLDQEPGVTSYSVMDYANTEYVTIKSIDKNGNVSSGIRYNLK